MSNVVLNPTGSRVAFADGLRACAALWVVFYHMSEGKHIASIKANLPNWLDTAIFDWGYLGVSIFFVLSGFVMAYTVRQIKVDGKTAGQFLLRRLTRLSPPYYFTIVVMLIINHFKAKVLGEGMQQIGIGDVLAHLVYLQQLLASSRISSVFWTLCIEIQFYIAFALLILVADSKKTSSSQYARLWVFGTAGIIALLWPAHITENVLWRGGFLSYWYSFLVGALVCWGWLESGKIRVFAGIYCVVVLVFGIYTQSLFTIITAFTGILLLLAGMWDAMGKWLSWKWIQFIALISYSLYLLHNPLTGIVFRIVNRWAYPETLNIELIGIILSILVCIFASWLMFLLIERPSIVWSHHFSGKPAPKS